jgi:hypothetical protein
VNLTRCPHTIERASRLLAALIVGLMVGACPTASAATSGNMLVNPGAEEGDGSSIAGWSASSTYRRSTYGSTAESPDVAEASGFGGGTYFLDPGRSAEARLEQTLDISGESMAIDGGQKELYFGGYFGGYATREDTARLLVTPLDAMDLALGPAMAVGGPTAAARAGRTVMLDCYAVGRLPSGTRRLRVVVEARGGDDANYGYADELWVTFDAIAQAQAGQGSEDGCRTIQERPQRVESPPVDAPADRPRTPSSATPRLGAYVVLTKSSKCLRGRRVTARARKARRAEVRRLRITARGRTTTLTGRGLRKRSIVRLRAKRTTVRIRLELRDGRVISARRVFRRCK